jgi:hypothetical protein
MLYIACVHSKEHNKICPSKNISRSCTYQFCVLVLFCETNEFWRACKYLGSEMHTLHTNMHQGISRFCARNRGQLPVGFYNVFQLILWHSRFYVEFQIFRYVVETSHAFSNFFFFSESRIRSTMILFFCPSTIWILADRIVWYYSTMLR